MLRSNLSTYLSESVMQEATTGGMEADLCCTLEPSWLVPERRETAPIAGGVGRGRGKGPIEGFGHDFPKRGANGRGHGYIPYWYVSNCHDNGLS